MDKNKLGLRYERLLLLAAPILLISLIVLFIALTSHSDTDQITANCLNSAASEIEKDLPSLTKNWEKGNPSHDKYWAIDYKHAIRTVFIFAHLNPVCNDRIDTELEKHSQKEPKEIVAAFNVEIKKITAQLESRPFKAFGVEIPEKATINILGTNIKISAMVFAQLCQIALTPILILWLGSLYNTRYRETLQIANAKEITEIFPHCINIYLV
ncbi:MAG: hypothetical protein HYR68_13605 [Burkholderiales bacterium]|nr:hypothetical protein [Burkholderiales bacterium]